jgi:hypothetical protein
VRSQKATSRATVASAAFLVALLLPFLHGMAQPDAQSFAARVERLSEEGGDFDTDNLISNERSYLEVVPALKTAGVAGGVYIGVGPDQNFSYIAQVRPAIAFIVDIRRDNLLLHLLFKAIFAAAPTRIEYLAVLTGRPPPDRPDAWRDAGLERIVAHIDAGTPKAEAERRLDRRLRDAIAGFGVPLSEADYETIARFHRTFRNAGLSLKFESRGRAPREAYPTFRDLLLATDRAGRSWNYLATERDYQFVRSLEARDLVVPVVGDLGGGHALAGIADLMRQRSERLSAFYISNVETYLYGGKYSQFIRNIDRLPKDARSVIIRSIFNASVSTSEVRPASQFAVPSRQ